MSKDHEILADRLNAEPVIFKGCSSSELGMIVGLAIVIWLPLSLLVAWLLGANHYGFRYRRCRRRRDRRSYGDRISAHQTRAA
jgi:conjugative transfer region protein (TIGR03750 family)